MSSQHNCIKCGVIFRPTDGQMRKSFFVCKQCRRIATRKRYEERKLAGLQVSGRSMPREYHRAYNDEYKLRPGVKESRLERFYLRMEDPAEQVKHAARGATRNAIRRGELKRNPCEVCGDIRTDAHHDDYAKPLDVRWLCRIHHTAHHSALREVASLSKEREGA